MQNETKITSSLTIIIDESLATLVPTKNYWNYCKSQNILIWNYWHLLFYIGPSSWTKIVILSARPRAPKIETKCVNSKSSVGSCKLIRIVHDNEINFKSRSPVFYGRWKKNMKRFDFMNSFWWWYWHEQSGLIDQNFKISVLVWQIENLKDYWVSR